MTWVMWEARSAPGQQEALLAWASDQASPDAQVYASEDRVVVIAEETGTGLPEPPNALLARPPYAWSFERVR
jgi:hypothetical protein